jgi:segregation and condensation protein B
MIVNDIQLEQIIEGALLASGQTLSVDRIRNLFEEGLEPSEQRVLITLERISDKCQSRGYELKKVATGYRFQVKQDCAKWVSRLWEEKPQRYSRALLETLSIIAYRQPVTRGEIESIRGVAVSSHITKTLLEREWIQVVGHRDVPGRPSIFGTTKMFLDYFSLSSLDQLPTLEEIQEIADANHALELEDKVQEGNFDFSSKESEGDGEDTLESAALDLAAADALVQSVEDAVFNKPDEEDEETPAVTDSQPVADSLDLPEPPIEGGVEGEISEEPEVQDDQVSSIDEAQALIAEIDENVALEQTGQEASKIEIGEPDEDALAQATIARMIAEQEALLNAKSSAQGQESVKAASSVSSQAPIESVTGSGNDSHESNGGTPVESTGSVFDDFDDDGPSESKQGSSTASAGQGGSVFDDFNDDADQGHYASETTSHNAMASQPEQAATTSESFENEDDELMAAMEDEMMAQLEEEQAQLHSEQAEENDKGDSKTLSDLASKFE